MHGGRSVNELNEADVGAVERGLPNLEKHIESIGHFGVRPIVALNRFAADTDEEVAIVAGYCAAKDIPFAPATHFADGGGAGTIELAEKVMLEAREHSTPYSPLYELEAPVQDKIRAVAQQMYGADDIAFTKGAERDLREIERLGYDRLPVCIAKTQNSLSDDPRLRGRPRDFEVTVRTIQVNAGAGFLVVSTGEILRMPGLPRVPQARNIEFEGGEIIGLR